MTFVELLDFPFAVGNVASKDGHCVISPASLKLPLKSVPDLADNHFEIVRREGALWVRDLGAAQGTMVNGEKLSKYALKATARLKVGRNEVVAGGPDSPVRFLISIPPQDDD